jgi:hypothetical protein
MSDYQVLHLTYKQLQRAYEAAQSGNFVSLVQLEGDQYKLVTERPRNGRP